MKIPNFLIIGAAKSGTTSLYHYLNNHPEIYMCPIKEAHYFNNIQVSNKKSMYSKSDYLDLFSGAKEEKAIGEATPTYICCEQAPKWIRKYNADMRLIAILRNPVERAFSNYIHALRRENKSLREFEEIVKIDKEKLSYGNKNSISRYVERGFYHEQLKRYYLEFNSSQIRIYLFEDLKNNPKTMTKDIFRFLNVDDTFEVGNFKQYNKSGLTRIKKIRLVHNHLRKKEFYILLMKIIPPELIEIMRTVIYPVKPDISSEAKNILTNIYYEDIKKLEKLINRDLSNWLNT